MDNALSCEVFFYDLNIMKETLNIEEFELTSDQLKAAKAVYRAMRKAHKLGVIFWDNYGAMQCYNSRKISCPVPDSSYEYSLLDNNVSYYEPLKNFQAGNADDELFFNLK